MSETACASDVNANGSIEAIPDGPSEENAGSLPCGIATGLVATQYAHDIREISAGERNHGDGAACGVRADGPQRTHYQDTYNYYMRGRAINHCFHGQGVTRMEAYVSLQRERQDGEGGYTQLDSAAAEVIHGAGTQYTPYATWDCSHTRSLFYRVEASAYSVVRGRGYYGLNRHTDARTCAD